MKSASVTLEDKYTFDEGRVFITGIQALVRLPLMQRKMDRAAGLDTAGFISGYRGSPLGGYDIALRWRRHCWRSETRSRGSCKKELRRLDDPCPSTVGPSKSFARDPVRSVWIYARAAH
jgi:indolepyruvate ferredoxin oxidoreductase